MYLISSSSVAISRMHSKYLCKERKLKSRAEIMKLHHHQLKPMEMPYKKITAWYAYHVINIYLRIYSFLLIQKQIDLQELNKRKRLKLLKKLYISYLLWRFILWIGACNRRTTINVSIAIQTHTKSSFPKRVKCQSKDWGCNGHA